MVLVAHGSGAAFQVADVAAVVAYDERALKLPGVDGVNAEIGRQFHRTAYVLGDVDKRTVAEYCAVEGGKEVVAIRYYAAQVLAHQVGIVFDGFRNGTEQNAAFGQLLLEGSFNAH